MVSTFVCKTTILRLLEFSYRRNRLCYRNISWCSDVVVMFRFEKYLLKLFFDM